MWSNVGNTGKTEDDKWMAMVRSANKSKGKCDVPSKHRYASEEASNGRRQDKTRQEATVDRRNVRKKWSLKWRLMTIVWFASFVWKEWK
jgi:hypothetical protein